MIDKLSNWGVSLKGLPEPKYRKYECHITVEPFSGDAVDWLKTLAGYFDFSINDNIMVGHIVSSIGYEILEERANQLKDVVETCGFNVWELKIAEILVNLKFKRKIT